MNAPDPPRPERSWLLILLATVVLTVFYYVTRADVIGVSSAARDWTPMTVRPVGAWLHFLAAGALLGAVPVAGALGLGFSPRQLGLGLGDARRGLILVAVGLPLAVLAGWIGAAAPATRSVYPLDTAAAGTTFPAYATLQFFYFGAWEVLFRGVLLFGLRSRFGDSGALAVQTALSVTAHFGRSLSETAAAVPAGLIFGLLDLRLGSVWYVAVLHWVAGVSQDWFIVHGGW
ncbi:MAG TPA: CPBP family intramembrane glutamic endopeptidase [Gemmatimonadales bacterium]|nr:CPBP family intramembrane glutamic endopeptidase [Gemmatimonadales bacterium]